MSFPNPKILRMPQTKKRNYTGNPATAGHSAVAIASER